MPMALMVREGKPVMSRSSKWIAPWVGRRWPVTMLMKVVLPAPLEPITPTVCCAGKLTVMSRAAIIEPKRLPRSRTERMGALMVPQPRGASAAA